MDEYEFDIEEWLPRFPLRPVESPVNRSSHGPEWLCESEQLWRLAAKRGDLGRTAPADEFVLAFGEPQRRDVTKMGGVPYRPAGLEWPRSRSTGDPYGMVAQFRFTESQDIVPNLPGDILLCFFENLWPHPYDEFSEPPVFEWYPLGITDLIDPEDVPVPSFQLPPPCYGLRYRRLDYADSIAVERLTEVLPKHLYDLWVCEETDRSLRGRYLQWSGLKIGGFPFWSFPEEAAQLSVEPGPLLASIGSLRGDCADPFPWANQPTEVWHTDFLFGLGQSVHIFLDEDGNLHPRIDVG